jgi:16S rRNA (guanine966-N2)-methyltransferase
MNSYPRRSDRRSARLQDDRAMDAESGGDVRAHRAMQSSSLPRPKKEHFSPRWLRIVGGEMRGQRVQYSGDPSIRPMKDRTRESVFNLLGGDLSGMLAIDLFAGTGVLGLESISRGARRAVLLEMLRPAVATIAENAARLKVADKVEIHNVDTLRWLKYIESTAIQWQDSPWVVFCCPPYSMWSSELERLRDGLVKMLAVCPIGSMFVVESEQPFDIRAELPEFDWDVRPYKPAIVGVAEKSAPATEPSDDSSQ